MKHLRKFNESIYNYEELREFCDTHLAYLKDQGFSIIINSVQIRIHKDRYMSLTMMILNKIS